MSLLDPWPQDIRHLLEQRLVRDIVDLISQYSHYDRTDWNWVRVTEYYFLQAEPRESRTMINSGLTNPTNHGILLFLLRLATSQVFLSEAKYQREVDFPVQSGYHVVTDAFVLSLVPIGYQIYLRLVSQRAPCVRETLFRTLSGDTTFSSTLEKIHPLIYQEDIRWKRLLALSGDFSGLLRVRGPVSPSVFYQAFAQYTDFPSLVDYQEISEEECECL